MTIFNSLTPYLAILFLSILFTFLSNKSILGKKLHSKTSVRTFKDNIIFFFIIISIFLFSLCTFLTFINYYLNFNILDYSTLPCQMVETVDAIVNNNAPLQDPVRTFPSTLGAQLGIIGSAIYAYNKIQGTPRVKVLAGLGALGVSTGMTFYTMAIENPIGFNMYMYSLSEYFNNGKWPNLIGRIDHKELIEQTTEKILSSLDITKAITPTFDEKSLILKAIEKLGTDWPKGPSNPSSFIGETNSLVTFLLDLFNSISDNLLQMIAVFFRPYPVSGYFDDLLGQQLIIYLSLFSIVSGLILLFIFFTINSLFLIHKDFIIKRFDNRLISFYIRYQAFLANLAMIHLPIFILVGLLVLAHGLYFLITHPIPYEGLGIDLHKFITRD